jgi:hypothetical protein
VSPIGFSILIVCMTALGALVIWGFIGAKMQAWPWRMLLLGLLVTVYGAIQQFKLSLPAPVIDGHSDATKIILEMREMSSVLVSVLLSMGGAVLGAAVSLQAARLYAIETDSLKSRLEDAELDIQELQTKIAAMPESSKEERDWWVHQLAEATDHLHELEAEAEKLGFPRKRHKRRRTNKPPASFNQTSEG